MKKLIAIITCLTAAFAMAASAEEKSEAPKVGWFEPVERQIEGWTISVDPSLISGENKEEGELALRMLANHLERIAILVPEPQLANLRKVGIWIEHKHPELANMQYHPGKDWLVERGYHPGLAKKVHIAIAKDLLSRQQMLKHPAVILHELAHAYHDQFLTFDHPAILAAFQEAVKKGNYEKVQTVDGRVVKHYALTDHKEYFAEATEAYLYRNDFYPFVAAELKTHDAKMYELMDEIWQSRAGS